VTLDLPQARTPPAASRIEDLDPADGTGGCDSNVLVVIATRAELQPVQEVLAKIDKNEAAPGIGIYEGEKCGAATANLPSRSNLGGIGPGVGGNAVRAR
jgi:hypothetical protein